MFSVRIKPSVLARLDQSKQEKVYNFDGTEYHLIGDREVTVPEIVGKSWIAHDTDLEIIYPDKR